MQSLREEYHHEPWGQVHIEAGMRSSKKMRDPRRCKLDTDSVCYPITVSATLSKYSFQMVTALFKRNSWWLPLSPVLSLLPLPIFPCSWILWWELIKANCPLKMAWRVVQAIRVKNFLSMWTLHPFDSIWVLCLKWLFGFWSSVPKPLSCGVSAGFLTNLKLCWFWSDILIKCFLSVISLSMGILQARILEWVAIPFSRGSSQPRDRTQVSHAASGFFTSWATREAQK